MKHQYQSTVFVIAVAIVMVAASRPVCADLGDQLAKLLPNDGAAQDDFGFSVAINGATAIVGAWLDDDNGSGSGSAYLFNATNGQQIAKLLPLDGAQSDGFGFSVAITGPPGNEVAIVGARGDDHNGERSGSAYLFDTSTGQQIAKLLPKDGAAGDIFGFSVAISGTTAIVGAIGDDDNGDSSGSAYLFDISDPTNPWQVAKLLPKDGAAGDLFGWSIGISGDTAIVGANDRASGSAYLFDISDPANPVQTAKLLADDRAFGDQFGGSVAINETTAIVGASRDDDNGSGSGSAYLFDAGGPTGTPARLTSFTVLDGTLISGGLPELALSDDMYLETEAKVTGAVHQPHLLRVLIGATTDQFLASTMDVTVEARISDIEATVWIFLRDWNTGEMVQVDQFTLGLQESIHRFTVDGAGRFVRIDGRIEMEIKKIVFFPFTLGGFNSFFDQLQIVVNP